MSRGWPIGKRGRESGASAVEFALVVPLLVALLFGIIEFGFILNQQISISSAAREGARGYALHYDEATFSLTTTVQNAAPTVSGLAAATNLPSGTCPSGQTVEVTVTKSYSPFTGLFAFLNGKVLTGKGVIRCGG